MPLLERTGRGVSLTPAGVMLGADAETVLLLCVVLSALEGASAALASARGEVTGPLRIGAFPTAVRTLLPGALVALGRDHPGLELLVTELDPVAAPEALRERRLDVALVHDYDVMPVELDPTLDAVPLLDETVYLATSDGGEDPGADPIGEARHAGWIVGSPGTACHAVTLRRGCCAAQPVVRHHVEQTISRPRSHWWPPVQRRQGVSLVPQLAAAQPPAEIRVRPLAARRRTRVTYRRGAATHPAVIACIAAIRSSTDAYLDR